MAGFTSDLGYEELGSFFAAPIDWEKIKQRCKKFVAIHSDNDPYVSLHYGDFFKQNLGAEVVMAHAMRHFSGDDGVTELPAALDALMKIAK